ncbi:MAG TPA: threonine-phosphate decarboxylase CobD [Anaerovoracaceae bacterium]|nr:threonine-phosphate decarboxylase CobD [Anaerovoracaceae bacterium]
MDYLKDKSKLQTNRPGKLIHGGDIYSAKERLSRLENPPQILDFSANINPLGLPEGVKQAIRDSVGAFDIYPDPLCRELITALSEYEGVPAEWLLCGNGAADLIYRTAYAVRPKKAMILAPTFAEYEEALHAVSCRVTRYELSEKNGFQVGEGLPDALEEDLDMLFLCNPNNPTGQLMTKELLHKTVRRCKALGILLFLDECFNEFLDEPGEYTAKGLLEDFDNLIILKAFTKLYAMAGIRLGHCISANTELLERIRTAGQPWSVSAPAQTAGIRAMQETNYLVNTKDLIREERDYLIPNLKALGITVIASNANYIFVNDPRSAETPLHEALFKKGILIRNCDNYAGLGPGYYRICIRQHDDNVKLIEAIKEVNPWQKQS